MGCKVSYRAFPPSNPAIFTLCPEPKSPKAS